MERISFALPSGKRYYFLVTLLLMCDIFSFSYRCFVYDAWENFNNSGFRVALSGDATCNGLFSVRDGSNMLKLTKGKYLTLIISLE